MSCTCPIGRTLAPEQLQALDDALRTGTPLRELEREYGVKRSPLGRHKLGCLGASSKPGTEHGQSGTDLPAPPRDKTEAPRARVPTEGIAPRDVPGTRDTGSFAVHVRELADTIVRWEWKGRRSVTLYSERWGLSREAVRERYRAAAAIASLDKGDLAEALEVALGEATRGAEDCGKKATELEGDVDMLAEAVKYRALEKGWTEKRWQLEGLLVSRVSVSLEGDPRIAGLWPVLWEALAELDAGRERFLEKVEALTQGALPGDVLPVPSEVVKEAVRRYEQQIGARSGAPALAGKAGA